MSPLHPAHFSGWPKIIDALERAGVTQVQIADKVRISQGFVSKLKSGAAISMRFEEGFRLYVFYLERIRGVKIAILKNGS